MAHAPKTNHTTPPQPLRPPPCGNVSQGSSASSVQFKVQLTSALGIIFFLRSLYSKFSSVQFKVQFCSVQSARGYLVWTLLGIISFLIFKVQMMLEGEYLAWTLWVLFYFLSIIIFKVQSAYKSTRQLCLF